MEHQYRSGGSDGALVSLPGMRAGTPGAAKVTGPGASDGSGGLLYLLASRGRGSCGGTRRSGRRRP
jgi:hypothetical protein